jgi:hypothetical protein
MSDYDYDDLKQEDAATNPKDNILAQLAGLAMDQKRAEAAVAAAEEALVEAKEELRRISERSIPELMDAAEMAEYTTKDGIKIKVQEQIRGSIPKEPTKNEAAFKWLEDNGHGDLPKREFIIRFAKSEEAWAKKFAADLKKRKKPLAYEVKRSVHANTLAAFVKGQLEAGVDFPLETFGVFRQRVSKIEVK